MGIEWIEQLFKELPSGIVIGMLAFLGILLILWILLPVWVLFIQWNIGKLRDEIRDLADLLESWEEKARGRESVDPKG